MMMMMMLMKDGKFEKSIILQPISDPPFSLFLRLRNSSTLQTFSVLLATLNPPRHIEHLVKCKSYDRVFLCVPFLFQVVVPSEGRKIWKWREKSESQINAVFIKFLLLVMTSRHGPGGQVFPPVR